MDDFNRMLGLAEKIILAGGLQAHAQVVVALSARGNIYHKVINDPFTAQLTDEKTFIEELVKNQDTQLRKMICLWAIGDVDVPSASFRKLLCDTGSLTGETEILLRSADHYIVKTCSQIYSII